MTSSIWLFPDQVRGHECVFGTLAQTHTLSVVGRPVDLGWLRARLPALSTAGHVFCTGFLPTRRSALVPAHACVLTACPWSASRVRGSKQMNTLQCARHVYRTEGVRGFYRGLTASYAGISETVICFAIYESLKQCLKDAPLAPPPKGAEKNSTNFFGLMAAAAVAKGCASCIAYPHGTCRLPRQGGSCPAAAFLGVPGAACGADACRWWQNQPTQRAFGLRPVHTCAAVRGAAGGPKTCCAECGPGIVELLMTSKKPKV